MDYLQIILKKHHRESQIEMRIALFNYVRDLPYKITGKQDPKLLFLNKEGDCAAKSKLLSLLFNKLDYKTRPLLVRYKLKNFPSEVRYIPNQIDYHHAFQIKLNNKWITVDATYDSRLSGKEFKINFWDGIHSTPLAEKPLAIKIGKENNLKFDKQFKLFVDKINIACKEHPEELKKYTEKFNEIISNSRTIK